jgi:lipopolysaccharide transport system ATP-binding protein
MSSSEIAVSVRGMSKSYTIAHQAEKHVTMAEALLHRLKNPFQRVEKETFWALKDMEFDIKKGDVVGIIGRNGAGKSTLLKILSRITEPTKGQIDLYGRVGSLLEVGTGFHPELTGRENIYLNGAIMGMSRREIDRQFDTIVDFAGVEQFLDTPVKRYSSGMYVRLAFAVAAHLNSEIMVVDEVLAVGDMEFQKKCLGKMEDVARSGRTVLFVSHQMQAVSTLCTKAAYLEAGALQYIGDVSHAIGLYMNGKQRRNETDNSVRRSGTGELRFTQFTSDKSNYLSIDDIHLKMEISAFYDTQPTYFISLEIVNPFGLTVLHLDSRLLNLEFSCSKQRTLRYMISAPRLAQGDYRVNAYLCSAAGIIDKYEGAAEFTISPLLPYPARRNDCVGNALVYPYFSIEEVPASTEHSAVLEGVFS